MAMAIELSDAAPPVHQDNARSALLSDSFNISLNRNTSRSTSAVATDTLPAVALTTATEPPANGSLDTVTKPPEAPPTAGVPAAANQVCKPTEDYQVVMAMAASTIYDVKSLGDLTTLVNDNSCGDLITKSNRALAVTGDIYNHLLSSDEVKSLMEGTEGHYAGVGMGLIDVTNDPRAKDNPNLTVNDVVTKPTIGKVMEGSAAAGAGLKPGDEITRVNGQDTTNMKTEKLVPILRGAIGTQVDVVVNRNRQSIETMLTRADVQVPSVGKPKDLGNGITYIRVSDFENEHTTEELKAAIEQSSQSKGFVIDVRENPGGLVNQGLSAAQLFVKNGTLMNEREREFSSPYKPAYDQINFSVDEKNVTATVTVDGEKSASSSAPRIPDVVGDRPVVILTDGGTASAAEIFTGAVHDTGKATTLGDTTYGKGIAQQVLPNGPAGTALKVTIGRYTTPSGLWPGDAGKNRIGLKPDIPVALPPDSQTDTQLDAAKANLLARIQH
jgi:carboxyl-terminal processing protease